MKLIEETDQSDSSFSKPSTKLDSLKKVETQG